ncbi:TPA: hypothetical protein ACH3X2_008400 [Trebouxia sp. C0005]
MDLCRSLRLKCFAREQFRSEVDHRRPDAHLHLAKACMLIALEEEAAFEDELLQNGRDEITWLKVLSEDTHQKDSAEHEQGVELHVVNRHVGTASSWSLSRLDSLAEEVKSCFMAQHTSLPDLPPAPSSNPHIRPSIAHQSDPTQIFTRNGDHAPSTQFAAGGRFVASRLVSLLRSLLGSSPVVPPSKVSNTTKLIDRQSSHSSASTSGPQMNNSSTSQARDADRQPAVPETGQHHTSGQSPIAETGQHHTSGQSPIADRSVVKAMQEYPMQTFAAINMVLFERHGYQRMQIHGNPRDAQLSSVLDNGGGTPAALAVLYMEVARRLGISMVAQPLEGGRECMIWPEHGLLRAGGESFVIDAYSQGAMYSMTEVAELFDLGSPTSLTPVSKRELLAVLLAALRDSHWCKAVDCQSEPGLMIPISLGVAASGTVQPMHGFDIARALAAAERRLFLLPESREVQLEHALLLYFAGQWDEAYQELQLYKQDVGQLDGHALDSTLARICCLLYERTTW